ncbi:hypothetical protein [Streptomyces sp. NPDC047000]|uniref:hypothetical protein n=1 Tax=Streptomyces sp. NPDC047000 TaxID=3155474 RepID=UPI0033C40317
MSEIAGQTDLGSGVADAVVHESYSFACMRCGHGWEQAYEIEHHRDADGTEFVLYVADGEIVPSPLSRPTCLKCDGHLVRIMAAGRVSSAQRHARRAAPRPAPRPAPGSAQPAQPARDHHWHLSDLLHPFHRSAG